MGSCDEFTDADTFDAVVLVVDPEVVVEIGSTGETEAEQVTESTFNGGTTGRGSQGGP